MKLKIFGSILGVMIGAFLLAPTNTAMADTIGATPVESPALAGDNEVAPTYTLAPGDVISIIIVNFPDLTENQLTIPPDGKLRLPLVGDVKALDQTVDELTKTLSKEYSEYVVDPSVTVQLTQKRSQKVVVYGYVSHADSVLYHPGLTLLETLALCGGASDDGDLTAVTVSHVDGKKETLDVSHPELKAGTSVDIALTPDDIIYVPQRHLQISVLGQVNKGGNFDYKDKMTVLDAITDADGIVDGKADLTAATLIHNGVESKLDLEGLLRQGKLDANLALSPGDRIFVPLIHDRTYVFGAVGKPGYYDYTPGDRVLDALNEVGGPTPDADLSRVNVIHIDKANNTAKPTTVNISKILTGQSVGDMTANVALAPGDILYVPTKGHKTSIGDIMNGLSSVGIIGSTLRLLAL